MSAADNGQAFADSKNISTVPGSRIVRVLAIEDNPADVAVVRQLLDATRFELKSISRLAAAFDLLAKEHFDVVLLDLSLPDSDGLDTFESMQSAAQQLPIILLTGRDDEVLAAESVKRGAQDYLVKGQIDAKLLSRSIRYGIERKRIVSENTRLYCEADQARHLAVAELTERSRVEAALRESEARLKEADRRKDEFLATLAHELRNPLAPIRNAIQILRLAKNDAATTERSLKIMERQIEHMVRLVDDLLDVSRISLGKIELRKEPIDLATVLKHALEASQPIVDAFGHTLTIDVPDQPIPLHADLIRLAQVFANLLNNAAKYTAKEGHIWLNVVVADNEVAVQVKDDGVGIEPHMLSQVFEMFTQVDRSLNRSEGGLGIGLNITRQLVLMHGGRIQGKSDGVGRGSEFVVTLPLDTRSLHAKQRNEPHRFQASQALACKVLVVDDNIDSAESLCILLGMTGSSTRMAHDGLAAVIEARSYKPDIILLDIGLPGMSGYEVARIVRTIPDLRYTLLVALTGWGSEVDRQKCKDAGFDHHLTKPASAADLEQMLTTWLNTKQNTTTR